MRHVYNKFQWDDGRVTYLWPDHPLVLAGDSCLSTVVDMYLSNEQPSNIIIKLSHSTSFTIDEITHFVSSITSAIDKIGNVPPRDTIGVADGLSMATVNITSSCNLSCNHCYAGNRLNSDGPELDGPSMIHVIDRVSELIKCEPRLIIFSGGEPLLRKDFLFKAITRAYSKGLNIRLNTNGIFIDDDTAEFLAHHDVLTQVSLDGMDKHTNALVRNDVRAYDKAIEGIACLSRHNCRTRLSCTLHADNIYQIEDFLIYAMDNSIEQVTFTNLTRIGNATNSTLTPIEYTDEFNSLYEVVYDNELYQAMTRSTLLAETINAIRAGMKFRYCGTGLSTCCIDSNGALYPCINMINREFYVGNAFIDDIDYIWRASPALGMLRSIDVDSMNAQCSKCIFRYFCGGYCRGETIEAGGSYKSPYVRCGEWKRGLTRILEMLSVSPYIYSTNNDPIYNILHRE